MKSFWLKNREELLLKPEVEVIELVTKLKKFGRGMLIVNVNH